MFQVSNDKDKLFSCEEIPKRNRKRGKRINLKVSNLKTRV